MIYSNRIRQKALGYTTSFTLGDVDPSFKAFPDGETKYTILAVDNRWQVGEATVASGILTLDTIEENSNGNTSNIDFTGVDLYIAQTITGLDMNNIMDHINNADLHIPVGGVTGQVLTKLSNDEYDTIWADGGGGSTPTGTNIYIDMGTFPEPQNANIDAGGFV